MLEQTLGALLTWMSYSTKLMINSIHKHKFEYITCTIAIYCIKINMQTVSNWREV